MLPTRSFASIVTSVLAFLPAACHSELKLPAPPATGAPIIESFDPVAGLGRTLVTIRGARLGRDRAFTRVRFATGALVQPSEIAPDASWLKVEVPIDASTGPIVVSTPHGQAQSELPFTFAGPGEPVLRELAANNPVGPFFERATTFAGETHALAFPPGSPSLLISWGRDTAPTVVPDVVALARSGNGEALLSLRGRIEGGKLVSPVLVRRTTEGTSEVPLPTNPDARDLQSPRFRIASDDGGGLVVAIADTALWIVDSTADPAAVRRLDAMDGGSWQLVAWVGGSRFAVVHGERSPGGFGTPTVRLLDAVSGTLLDEPRFTTETGGNATSLVAAPGKRLVVGRRFPSRAEIFDAAGADAWAPAGVLQIDDLREIALTRDGGRLAVASYDGIVVHALDEPGRPALGFVPKADARHLTADGDRFLVGEQNRVSVIAATTGQPLRPLLFDVDVRGGVHHPVRCPGDANQRDVLDVLARGQHAVIRLDPRKLEVLDGCQPVLPIRAKAPDAILGAPDGDLYVVHEGRILRLPSDSTRAADVALDASDLDDTRRPAISLDGRWLAYATTTAGAELQVVALDGAWPATRRFALAVDGLVELAFGPGETLNYVRYGAEDTKLTIGWVPVTAERMGPAIEAAAREDYVTLLAPSAGDVLVLEYGELTRVLRVPRDGSPPTVGAVVPGFPTALSPNRRTLVSGERFLDFDPSTLTASGAVLTPAGDVGEWLFSSTGHAAFGIGTDVVVFR